jgi:kynurenine formamidase
MKISFTHNNQPLTADLSKPIDISLAVSDLTRAWYINPPKYEPVRLGENWVGSVAEGGDVNFFDITFNPHAHGTHTECLGHVTKERHSVNQALRGSWFVAELISVETENRNGDKVITVAEIAKKCRHNDAEALIIRTTPNDPRKATENLSSINWPYLEKEAAVYIRERGIKHLLIDQPSVDKEEDGGAMAAHKAFWNIPQKPDLHSTITELIFVPDEVEDGLYVLNLQVAPMENDAAPSRPVLYGI